MDAPAQTPGYHAARDPDRPAIVMAETGEVVTYAELESRSARVARALRAAGLRPGDHVALLLDNRAAMLELAWAAQRSGLYYTPINTRLAADEAAYVVDDCGATVLFAAASVARLAGEVRDRTPRVDSLRRGRRRDRRLRAAAARSSTGSATSPSTTSPRVRRCSTRRARPDAQGRAAPRHRPAVRHRQPRRPVARGGDGVRAGQGVPDARAALPLGAAGVVDDGAPTRRHARAHGALRRAGVSRRHRPRTVSRTRSSSPRCSCAC